MPVTATAPHPGNDYYVNALTGTIQRQSNPVLAAGLHAAGFIGPYDWANASGIAAGLHAAGATTPTGAGPIPSDKVLNSSLNPLQGIAKTLSMFTSANLWLRVGEVVVGLILLGIGINAMFHGRPMKAVTGAAGLAAKAVP